jgi:hypothetical protein
MVHETDEIHDKFDFDYKTNVLEDFQSIPYYPQGKFSTYEYKS